METQISPSSTGAALVTIAAASLFIMLSLNQINYIVHGDLYNYGLQFTYRWAMPYWVLSGVVFGLCWVNISIAIIATLYIYKKSRRQPKNNQYETPQEPATYREEQRKLAEYVQPQNQGYELEPVTQEETLNQETELIDKESQQTHTVENLPKSQLNQPNLQEAKQSDESTTEIKEATSPEKETEENKQFSRTKDQI